MTAPTKTIEGRVAALETTVAAVPRRGRWVSSYEQDILNDALQYARVTKLGFYVEGDTRRRVDGVAAEEVANYFLTKMKRSAEDLLREMSIEESTS